MKKIKFDGLEYEVKLKDKSNDNNMGLILYKKLEIEIDESMPEQLQRSTLFHECTHLVLASLGETELNDNEGFVERLSNAFYRLVKDNKNTLFEE